MRVRSRLTNRIWISAACRPTTGLAHGSIRHLRRYFASTLPGVARARLSCFPLHRSSRGTPIRIKLFVIAAFTAAFSTMVPAATGPRFYQDDPIARVPESQDASRAAVNEIDDL